MEIQKFHRYLTAFFKFHKILIYSEFVEILRQIRLKCGWRFGLKI
jgi:hypothetical protein